MNMVFYTEDENLSEKVADGFNGPALSFLSGFL